MNPTLHDARLELFRAWKLKAALERRIAQLYPLVEREDACIIFVRDGLLTASEDVRIEEHGQIWQDGRVRS